MKITRWLSGLAVLLTPCLAASQEAGKKLPPPLREAFVASDRDYYSFAFNADSTRLAAGADGLVRVLQVATPDAVQGVEIKQLKHPGRVHEVCFQSQAKILVSRSRDQDVQIWDMEKWLPLKFAVEDRAANDLVSPALLPQGGDADSSYLLLLNQARGLRVWMMDGLRQKRRFVVQAEVRDWAGVALGHITAVASIDKDLLVGDDQGYLCRLPDVRSVVRKIEDSEPQRFLGKLMKTVEAARIFRPHLKEITSIALSAGAQRCVTAGLDGKVRLWDLGKVPQLSALRGGEPPKPEWEISGLLCDLSQDGKILAVSDDEGVGVYQAASGIALSWNAIKGRIVRLRLTPDGRYLAALVCRCMDCTQAGGIAAVRPRRRLADHGGTLVLWK